MSGFGETFKSKGYDADTRMGFGSKPGVVVVDFQKAFIDPRFPLAGSAHVERAVQNTAILLRRRAPRARRWPIPTPPIPPPAMRRTGR